MAAGAAEHQQAIAGAHQGLGVEQLAHAGRHPADEAGVLPADERLVEVDLDRVVRLGSGATHLGKQIRPLGALGAALQGAGDPSRIQVLRRRPLDDPWHPGGMSVQPLEGRRVEQVLEHLLREKRPVQAAILAPGTLAGEDGLGAQAGGIGILTADHRIEGDGSQPAQVVGVKEESARAAPRRRLVEEPEVVGFGGGVDEGAAVLKGCPGQQSGGLALAHPGEHRHGVLLGGEDGEVAAASEADGQLAGRARTQLGRGEGGMETSGLAAGRPLTEARRGLVGREEAVPLAPGVPEKRLLPSDPPALREEQ